MLRRALSSRIGVGGTAAFQFHATRCDRVVAFVLDHVSNERGSLKDG
jgi:hypothetical protein